MVELCILQKTQRTNGREGVISDNRLDVVVEINYVGFPEA